MLNVVLARVRFVGCRRPVPFHHLVGGGGVRLPRLIGVFQESPWTIADISSATMTCGRLTASVSASPAAHHECSRVPSGACDVRQPIDSFFKRGSAACAIRHFARRHAQGPRLGTLRRAAPQSEGQPVGPMASYHKESKWPAIRAY